jgi:hypothetical protein
LLFGINYVATRSSRLRGCWNDVSNMRAYLNSKGYRCIAHTDGKPQNQTTKFGMIDEITKLAKMTHTEDVDRVVIHYSGHGSYVRDTSNDEKDGKDECLVPSDYAQHGMLLDDEINALLCLFHPKAHVTCIFDCCHSGTIADLKYKYVNKSKIVENGKDACQASVIMLSGCMDSQTSADAYNVLGARKFSGAMTSCLLTCLKDVKNKQNVFQLLDALQSELRFKRFKQVPQLCTNIELLRGEVDLFM